MDTELEKLQASVNELVALTARLGDENRTLRAEREALEQAGKAANARMADAEQRLVDLSARLAVTEQRALTAEARNTDLTARLDTTRARIESLLTRLPEIDR